MDATEISARIKSFFEESYPHQGKELTLSTDLLNGWFVDSLGIVMTVAFLEKTFEIDIKSTDVNITNFLSIDTLTDFVSHRLEQK